MLGDMVYPCGHKELGAGACMSRGRARTGGGAGKASALPGLYGGAALRTLLYHGVELALGPVRAFRCNQRNRVSDVGGHSGEEEQHLAD